MNIAMDFDSTLTEDPDMWGVFIRNAKERGHSFWCVTARRDTEDNVDTVNEWLVKWNCQMPIVFTALRSKLMVVSERGIRIDIWIDDDPKTLVQGFV